MHAARRLLHVLLVVFVLLVGAAAAAAIVSQTAWFKNRIRVYVVAQASQYLNGTISVNRLGGNLFSGLELEGVSIALNGQPVVSARNIGLRYNLYQLITSDLTIDELRIDEPVVHLQEDAEGWTIDQLIKKQENEADRRGPLSPIKIDDIGISNGSILVDTDPEVSGVQIPKQIERLDAKLSFAYEPVHYSIAIDHISFRATEPDLALNSFSGAMAIRDDTLFLKSIAVRTAESSLSIDGAIEQYLSSPVLKLKVTSDKTSIPELAKFVPAIQGIELQPAFEAGFNGPLDRLGVDVNVRSSAGQLTGTLTTDLAAPGYAASGNLSVRHVNLAPLLKDAKQASDLTADAVVDLRTDSLSDPASLTGTVKIDAPRIVAAGYTLDRLKGTATLAGRRVELNAQTASYGASATVTGRVVLPESSEPIGFDLRGQARRLDVRALPKTLSLPSVETNINADYHIVGHADVSGRSNSHPVAATVDATLADSTIANAKIESGSTVNVDARSSDIAYGADATVREVDLQELGKVFSVPALTADQYRSRIDGHVVLNGRGTAIKTLQADANGTIENASVMGGEISNTTFSASVANNSAHVKATGTFADLDPGTVSGNDRLKGNVGGQFDLDAKTDNVASGVSIEAVSGTAKLALNGPNVGGLSFDHATLDADYHDRTAEIRQLEVIGPDAKLTAQGTLALGNTGSSNLTFHADSPRVAEIATVFDVPLSGIATVDGTVTGNGTALKATGKLTADDVAYQDNSALTLSTSYTAKVPELDFKRASVDADSKATFVKVADQQIDELSGNTTYVDQRLAFDMTASQPQRSASAAGSLLFHPDHQEVHVDRAVLKTANQEWSTQPGEEATINYSNGIVTVDKAHLVSGDQEIVADGQLGAEGSAIDVKLNNIDVARVNEILLRPPQFTGRLNATATVEGTREHPIVNGQFQIDNGGFRQFTYQSFGGTLRYEPRGLTIDSKLQQSADQWITAKGYLPAALFTANGTEGAEAPETGHVEPANPDDRVDLMVDSSPFGLGIIQGLTDAVTNVQGTAEAHVHITGSAHDPHPSGTITLANGAMTVPSTGVVYSHMAGRVDLQEDRVHIDEITILDNHDSALSVTGDLAVHAGDVGKFQLYVNADDFKVVDNKLGNLRVQGALELGGELRSPEIRGDFGVSTGRLDLDQILPKIPSAYSTEAIAAPNAATAPVAEQQQKRSTFDALKMNVRITVPDDLIVNSSGIEVPGALIDLGALNVTLGGDLTAIKEPSGTVRLTGAVTTVRGTYEFQGRRFDVLREGGLHFEGTEDFDPRLDLRTHRIIQGVDAHVDIVGTLKQPRVQLSSTPPLEDADILALVVFNQNLNQLGTGEQTALVARAQNLAAGAVTGALSKSIAKALNLETFQFDVAGENGAGPALTVGQQVGPNLYLKVQQAVGGESTTNVLIEYAFTNWMRLQTNVQQGSQTEQSLFQRPQGTGADLIFLFSK
ncbi:MAG TPA: translocation/assembly module TamB domain-containing protein [Vicinamibacterales bacterium]